MDRTSRNINIFFLFIVIIYILSVMAKILIPLVLAILIALIFEPLVMFLMKRKVAKWLIMPIVIAVTLLLFLVIARIVMHTFDQIVAQQDVLIDRFYEKVSAGLVWVNETFQTSLTMDKLLGGPDGMHNALGSMAGKFGSFAGSFFMFSLYFIVLVAGMPRYRLYLAYVGGEQQEGLFLSDFEIVRKSIIQYVTVKTFISALTGIFAGLICWAFGIKFAIFWGFLTFLLNYIPTIGSVISVFPPVFLAIVQFDSAATVAFLFVSLGVNQTLLGSVLDPMIMGKKLRINTVTVLFGLVFWGYLWGIPGMVLSVPMMVIVKLVLEHTSGLAFLGRAMGFPDHKAVESAGLATLTGSHPIAALKEEAAPKGPLEHEAAVEQDGEPRE